MFKQVRQIIFAVNIYKHWLPHFTMHMQWSVETFSGPYSS